MQKSMQNWWEDSALSSVNSSYLDDVYRLYLQDPNLVSKNWSKYLADLNKGIEKDDIDHEAIKEYFRNVTQKSNKLFNRNASNSSSNIDLDYLKKQVKVHELINHYRLLGHLYSHLDPLNLKAQSKVKELELTSYPFNSNDNNKNFDVAGLAGYKQLTLSSLVDKLQNIYCGSVASEFMHIIDSEERLWVQNKVEKILDKKEVDLEEKISILESLTAADGLEKYLAAKYPGAKRFGLEGCDSLIVALEKIIYSGGANGLDEIVIGMAHRGRLNVLVNLLGKHPRELFDEFEGKHSVQLETGDVRYHQGFASNIKTSGGNVHLSLIFNPSHLEIVTPVVCGSVRARQERRKVDSIDKVMPIILHGDAAFAGQGVVMETLNMSQTRGYSTGGSIHIIVNNQIGFTTSNPRDARSTLYCSDIGKMIQAPIFHVNVEDPESVALVAELALEYRTKFNKDVIVDLVGYRKHGHNEADEPAATQPVMYKAVRAKESVRAIYAEKLINESVITEEQDKEFVETYRNILDARERKVAKNLLEDTWQPQYAADWKTYKQKGKMIEIKTGVNKKLIKHLADIRDKIPENFVLHPRVQNIVNSRIEMNNEQKDIDWGYGETLAYATLLNEGYNIRLSGQDCGRGTFFHRHVVWHNQTDASTYISLNNINDSKSKFTVIDSLLSEEAVLAYEYGFSTSDPKTLVIWEAQFGDFANGAQVVIDQFISSGEQKWGRLSGLTLLLPHGHEGQGPEHSSARLERFLQLCAQHNMQVCVPSTPAQVFHMLRRQMLQSVRKPLIAITPKSTLRHKLAVSKLDDLTSGGFQYIIQDNTISFENVKKVVLCSGKIYYELCEERERQQRQDEVAIIRIEQLYPFPEAELREMMSKFSEKVKTVIWCQEEPLNQGAWYSSQHHLRACLKDGQELVYAGREALAAPSVGYMHLHEEQSKRLLSFAIG